MKPVTHSQVDQALADALAKIEHMKHMADRQQYKLRVQQQANWVLLGVAAAALVTDVILIGFIVYAIGGCA